MLRTLFKIDYLIVIIFFMTFMSDSLTRVCLNDTLNVSLVVKAVLIIALLILCYKKDREVVLWIGFSFGLVGLGMILNYQDDFLSKTAQFLEYFSGILAFTVIFNGKKRSYLRKTLSIIFSFYILNILIATVFELIYFKTYFYSDRFGYMPLFSSQNEFSFIMITIVSYFYITIKKERNLINQLLFFASFSAAVCVGTKIIYLYLFLFVGFIIYERFGLKKFSLLSMSFLLINLIFFNFWIDFLKSHFQTLVLVYEQSNLINAISSNRLIFMEMRLECQQLSFSAVNYLFGGSTLPCITEMSIIDIFLFFGIVGSILYFYLFTKLVVLKIRLDSFLKFYLAVVSLLSFVGGYFFENFSAQLYAIGFICAFYQGECPTLFKKQKGQHEAIKIDA